jgi:hypothetical protein
VPPPNENARSSSASIANVPTERERLLASAVAVGTTIDKLLPCAATPYAIKPKCRMTKPRKIGSSTTIDSFMPRKFRPVISTISVSSVPSLKDWVPTGRRLKNASTPLARDVAMVNT